MSLLARSAGDRNQEQTYSDHIREVVTKSLDNLHALAFYVGEDRTELYEEILRNAAEYHDLGKLNAQNQEVLHEKNRAKKLPINHRDAGLKFLLDKDSERIEATLVYAHHRPGLPDLVREEVKDSPFRFTDCMSDSEAHLEEYLQMHYQELGNSISKAKKTNRSKTKRSSMEYRMLLSCLVDGDYTSAQGYVEPLSVSTRWSERIGKLDQYITDLSNEKENNQRNQMRKNMYYACRDADTDNPIEYCGSPVGTGKTTAVMAHMLKVAEKYKLRHIIVVLPYTNIITQTVKTLRDAVVLEDEQGKEQEVVAELHHQVDFDNSKYKYLATTWRAPIIVTTAVEFFETLASNQPAKLRKLHQLTGSAIILDEYHTMLPLKLMLPAWQWLNDLTSEWGCHICMSSATPIEFWKIKKFKKKSNQSVSSLLPPEINKQLSEFERKRVTHNILSEKLSLYKSATELKEHVEKFYGSKIVLFNTIQNAAYFANYLKANGCDVLHLSTALKPEDQKEIIKEVKHRLENKVEYQNWYLVVTSGVECGLDISFHYGFCELNSLQNLLQLLGRICRESDFEDSFLEVFKISDDHFVPNSSFEISIEIYEEMMKLDELKDCSDNELVSIAFKEECKKSDELSEEICDGDLSCEFETVASKFKVIDEDTVTVLADKKLAEKIRSGKFVSAMELQMGSVNMRRSVQKKLGLRDDDIMFLSDKQYDNFIGYMKSLV